MKTVSCFCPTVFSGEDNDALFAEARAHFDAAHPELRLSDAQIRNYIDATDRLTGSTERLEQIGAVEVHELTVDRLDDWLAFFDHDAFADNPGWAACYCVFHHRGGSDDPEWLDRTWQQNRDEMEARLRAGTASGVVAYVDGRLAAWCNAAVRTQFPQHLSGAADDARTGVIMCFAVAPPYRGHGLASKLLDGALDTFTRKELAFAEAYPPPQARDDAAGNYHGTLSMYLQRGFEQVDQAEHWVVVRKSL